MGNRREMFKLLFDAASQTLLQLASDPQWLGGRCSITSVLHIPPQAGQAMGTAVIISSACTLHR
jgi:hypothetical protein